MLEDVRNDREFTYMTAMLATSEGWPNRRTGTLAAMARPGSVSFSSSRSVFLVHVLCLGSAYVAAAFNC